MCCALDGWWRPPNTQYLIYIHSCKSYNLFRLFPSSSLYRAFWKKNVYTVETHHRPTKVNRSKHFLFYFVIYCIFKWANEQMIPKLARFWPISKYKTFVDSHRSPEHLHRLNGTWLITILFFIFSLSLALALFHTFSLRFVFVS